MRRHVAAVFLCLLGKAAAPLHAASLQVTPVLLEFSAREQGKALVLGNNGKLPLRAQVRVLSWTQDAGEEQFEATRELVASPPLLEIAAGASQTVRIVRLQTAAPAQERSYRLIVDELPAAGPAPPMSAGLQFFLRYSVPVFVLPGAAVEAGPRRDVSVLSASLSGSGSDGLLDIANAGSTRVRISQLVHVAADGRRQSLVPGLLGYVLAGRRMQWPLALEPSLAAALREGATLRARFDDDEQEQVLPLAVERP